MYRSKDSAMHVYMYFGVESFNCLSRSPPFCDLSDFVT